MTSVDSTPAGTSSVHWRRPPMIRNAYVRWGVMAGALAYFVVAFMSVEVNASRLAEGVQRGWQFMTGFFPPDFVSQREVIIAGLMESVGISIVSTACGVVLSIPVAFGAARNLVPLPVYAVCRSIIIVSRSLQEVILAILFVAIVGFGPLAGIITLSFATIGFFAKLLAEEIESIPPNLPASIRATGASPLLVWWWAIAPQVRPRVFGLTLYRLDINFRESTVIGIVGAGGIGAALHASLSRYEFDTTAAILILIILIVITMEYGSSVIRRRLI